LRRVILTIELPEVTRFARLSSRVCEVMDVVLLKCLNPTNQMIKNLIAIEDSFINTNHPDFMGGANSMLSIFQSESEPPS
jgi:dynamin 1-like protein